MLKAWEAQIKLDTVLLPKLQESQICRETSRLVSHQSLIRDTQTMIEGPPKRLVPRIPIKDTMLEAIQEFLSSEEQGSILLHPDWENVVVQSCNTQEETLDGENQRGIPEVKESWGNTLWK